MPSKVLFNGTPYPVQLTLYVRAGLAPGRVASSVQAYLAPGDERRVEFGDEFNRTLEGLELSWVQDGARHVQRRLVVSRDSPWESTLNRSEALLVCSLAEVDVRSGVVEEDEISLMGPADPQVSAATAAASTTPPPPVASRAEAARALLGRLWR